MARNHGQQNSPEARAEGGLSGLMAYNVKGAVDGIIAAGKLAFQATEPYPPHLYHYTNATGLQGILRSKTIWATQFDFLNDSSEFLYAADFLQRHLQARGDAISSAGWNLDGLTEAVRASPHHVTSFCEDGDLLSQWRGYARTNDGYAAGFEFASLSGMVDRRR